MKMGRLILKATKRHEDRRTRRNRTRADKRRQAIKEQEEKS